MLHFIHRWVFPLLFVLVYVQVASIVLEWINNHYSDFETDTNLSEFLEQFEALMEKQVCLICCYLPV